MSGLLKDLVLLSGEVSTAFLRAKAGEKTEDFSLRHILQELEELSAPELAVSSCEREPSAGGAALLFTCEDASCDVVEAELSHVWYELRVLAFWKFQMRIFLIKFKKFKNSWTVISLIF